MSDQDNSIAYSNIQKLADFTSLYYKELIGKGIPDDLARELTVFFHNFQLAEIAEQLEQDKVISQLHNLRDFVRDMKARMH